LTLKVRHVFTNSYFKNNTTPLYAN